MARVLKRRRGGLPPIVTVLIVLAAVAAAGLVAWFLFTTTSAAVKQPVLEVTDAYAVGRTLRFTVRNLGAQTVTSLQVAAITCSTGSGPSVQGCNPGTLNPGASAVCAVNWGTAPSDGSSCTAELQVTAAGATTRVLVGFRVVVP